MASKLIALARPALLLESLRMNTEQDRKDRERQGELQRKRDLKRACGFYGGGPRAERGRSPSSRRERERRKKSGIAEIRQTAIPTK